MNFLEVTVLPSFEEQLSLLSKTLTCAGAQAP